MCRKMGIFTLLLLFGKSYWQITCLGVTFSEYLIRFEISVKFCVFLFLISPEKLFKHFFNKYCKLS
jgi:hypothetical protein